MEAKSQEDPEATDILIRFLKENNEFFVRYNFMDTILRKNALYMFQLYITLHSKNQIYCKNGLPDLYNCVINYHVWYNT